MFPNCLLVQLRSQYLNILKIHVSTQLEILVIKFLNRARVALVRISYFNQLLDVLYQMKQLLVIFVVVVRNDRNTVLQLIEI